MKDKFRIIKFYYQEKDTNFYSGTYYESQVRKKFLFWEFWIPFNITPHSKRIQHFMYVHQDKESAKAAIEEYRRRKNC